MEAVQGHGGDLPTPIDKVGFSDLRYPITIMDRVQGEQMTVARLAMSVGLHYRFLNDVGQGQTSTEINVNVKLNVMSDKTIKGSEETLPLVSRRLKEIRIKKVLTQEDLHEKSGVPLPTIKDIERGATQHPRPNTLHQLALALGIKAEDFFREG